MSSPTLPIVQQPQPSTQGQRWRPGPFEGIPGELDRHQLDVAIKTIYDHSYGLEQSSVQAVVQGSRMASGVVNVAGRLNAVVTGLTTLSNVVATVDSGGTPSNKWVTATPSTTVPGAFDVAVWHPTSSTDNTPALILTVAMVRWIAFGT
jgi:hypothetical protein